MRLYDRFWTPDECCGGGEMVRTLHAELTLFQVSAKSAETARHRGPLSLKMTRRGETQYRFGARNVVVQPGQLLLVPASAEHSTHVDGQGADILTFYLPARMIADVVTGLTAAEGSLLDQPDARSHLADFAPHHRAINLPIAAALRSVLGACGAALSEDITFQVLEAAAGLALEASDATLRIAARRPSVRNELFRRANQARLQIEQQPERETSLADLAAIACLSPYHLHRVFRAAFRETPAAMRRRLQIDAALTMLRTTRVPVQAVAAALGFETGTAFSRSFRHATGMSPRQFRDDAKT